MNMCWRVVAYSLSKNCWGVLKPWSWWKRFCTLRVWYTRETPSLCRQKTLHGQLLTETVKEPKTAGRYFCNATIGLVYCIRLLFIHNMCTKRIILCVLMKWPDLRLVRIYWNRNLQYLICNETFSRFYIAILKTPWVI